MDLIIAGKDVVTTDATASRAMGFDPAEISHIRTATQKGIGNIDNRNPRLKARRRETSV